MATSQAAEAFERMLAELFGPAEVRAIEAGGNWAGSWHAVEASGFPDALVPEEHGGAGLSMAEAAPLLMALGRHAVPLPVGETMIARALLAIAGLARPEGPVVLASVPAGGRATAVPGAQAAAQLLVECDGVLALAAIRDVVLEPTGMHRDLSAHVLMAADAGHVAGPGPAGRLRAAAGVLRACQIAGAADRLLGMTVAYANDRVQFGKPIGRQQAVQQQLAVMAELTVATRLAAEAACAGGLPPPLAAAAVAKHVASANAAQIANIAHAVHGAIGISEEHDLQIFTRRLHQWRLADGTEGWWAETLGRERLAAKGSTLDFIRAIDAKG